MATPEDREQELRHRELEIQAKEREIRLRELEIEIHQQQNQEKEKEIDSSEPPLYKTQKHNPPESSLKRFGRKLIKFGKFIGFTIIGIACIRVGFLIGMWIAYLGITAIIAFIGYQIFFNDDN